METVKAADIETLKGRIEKELTRLELEEAPKELYEPIRYTLSLGGKRMRPILTLLGCDLFGGNTESAMPAALAIELFHNFTLIHDDIMDNAPLRRNQPTVHHKWNNNIAILSGDATLVWAYKLLARCEEGDLQKALPVFNKHALQVCEGQQLDMNFEDRMDVSTEEYLNMISLKTAALLDGSLRIGAILGNASETDMDHLGAFGRNLGIAFQLKDDSLDVFGDPEKFGKRAGGDIIARKKTFLLIKALELADESTRTELERLLGNDEGSDEELITSVIAIYRKLGIEEITNTEMNRYRDVALEHLNNVAAEQSRKDTLASFTGQLQSRQF